MSSSDHPLQAVISRPAAYTLDSTLPLDELQTLAPGTNLLIEGPAQTNKHQLATKMLAAGTARGEHTVIISPDMSADRLSRSVDSMDADTDYLYIVDCTGATGKGSFDDEERVKFVSSPGDLTGIGMGLVKCTQAVGADAAYGLRVGVLSVSTLLRYAEVNRVFNFLHVLTGRVSAAGYLGIYTIDSAAHDESDLNVLRSLFDAAVKLRETDDGTLEAKIVGLDDVDSSWTEI